MYVLNEKNYNQVLESNCTMPEKNLHFFDKAPSYLNPENNCQDEIEAPDDDCGVCAVFDLAGNAKHVMNAINIENANRGRASAGGSTINIETGELSFKKQLGHPRDLFTAQDLDHQVAHMAIGHTRYTTDSETTEANAQPFCVEDDRRRLVIAHNGNLNNKQEINDQLIHKDKAPGTSDSAIAAQLIFEAEGESWMEKFKTALPKLNGSFSLTAITDEGLIVARDPRGNRPLWIGYSADGDRIIVASESSSLENRGCTFFPVEPGTIIQISPQGEMIVQQYVENNSLEYARCMIEHTYFQRDDSRCEVPPYRKMSEIRQDMGKYLAQDDPLFNPESDEYLFREGSGITPDQVMIVGVPNGGLNFAKGYAEALGTEPSEVIKKIEDVRSFMEPPKDRLEAAKRKIAIHETNPGDLVGKTIILIDDSVIRGTMMKAAIEKLKKEYGVAAVHVRSGTSEIRNSCDLGVLIEAKDLLYNQCDGDPIRMAQQIQADSILFQSRENLLRAVWGDEEPDTVEEGIQQLQSERDYRAGEFCFGCMQKKKSGTLFVNPYVPAGEWMPLLKPKKQTREPETLYS